jgi:hypothetical protein
MNKTMKFGKQGKEYTTLDMSWGHLLNSIKYYENLFYDLRKEHYEPQTDEQREQYNRKHLKLYVLKKELKRRKNHDTK